MDTTQALWHQAMLGAAVACGRWPGGLLSTGIKPALEDSRILGACAHTPAGEADALDTRYRDPLY